MAIIKCIECGNDISDKALTCPHCGYPLNLNSKTNNNSSDNIIVKTTMPDSNHVQCTTPTITKPTSVTTPKPAKSNISNSIQPEKKPRSNILAMIMLFFFMPLGILGVMISIAGIVWSTIELADEKIKKKGWSVVSLIIFIFILILGISTMTANSSMTQSLNNYIIKF